ncbi:unnamed protein product, partial [Allacma fusca]
KKAEITKVPSTETYEIPAHLSEGRMKFSIRLKPSNLSCPHGELAQFFYLDTNRPLFENPSKYESEFSSGGFFRDGHVYYPPEVF